MSSSDTVHANFVVTSSVNATVSLQISQQKKRRGNLIMCTSVLVNHSVFIRIRIRYDVRWRI